MSFRFRNRLRKPNRLMVVAPLAGAMLVALLFHPFPLHRWSCKERGSDSDKAEDHHRAEGQGEITGALVEKADQWWPHNHRRDGNDADQGLGDSLAHAAQACRLVEDGGIRDGRANTDQRQAPHGQRREAYRNGEQAYPGAVHNSADAQQWDSTYYAPCYQYTPEGTKEHAAQQC